MFILNPTRVYTESETCVPHRTKVLGAHHISSPGCVPLEKKDGGMANFAVGRTG